MKKNPKSLIFSTLSSGCPLPLPKRREPKRRPPPCPKKPRDTVPRLSILPAKGEKPTKYTAAGRHLPPPVINTLPSSPSPGNPQSRRPLIQIVPLLSKPPQTLPPLNNPDLPHTQQNRTISPSSFPAPPDRGRPPLLSSQTEHGGSPRCFLPSLLSVPQQHPSATVSSSIAEAIASNPSTAEPTDPTLV